MPPRPPEPLERRRGVLLGWRCWTVLPTEGLLRPIWRRGLIWKPGQPCEAVCAEQGTDPGRPGGRVAVHQVPEPSCRCGIWSVCHPMLLTEVDWKWDTPEILVIGQVALWGKIIEYERGWRAQFAYPTHLYLLADDAMLGATLRERYACPVAWGAGAARLEQVLPPGLRPPSGALGGGDAGSGVPHLVPHLRLVSPAPKKELPAVAVALPMVVDMVHAQEADELAEARAMLKLERERVEQLRALLQVDRERRREDRKALTLERQRWALEQERRPAPSAGPTTTRWPGRPELKAQLKRHGLTHQAVADSVGVSRTMVVNFLAGRTASRRIDEAILKLLSERGVRTKRS